MDKKVSRRQVLVAGAGAALFPFYGARAQNSGFAVKFADNPSISWPQPYIASRDGLWKKNSVDVSATSQRFGTGQSSLNALLQSDEVHMAIVAETPITLALIAGMPLRIITGLSSTTWFISTRRSTNIKSLKDLAGHNLGVAVGTSAEYFMDRVLGSVGLSQKDVRVINVKPTDMVPALSGGSLDAFFIWDPFRFEARRILGDQYVELSYPAFRSNSFLVTKEQFAEKHKDLIAPILRSLIEANRVMQGDPAASASYMAGLMGINPDIANAVWGVHRYDVALRHEMVKAFEDYANYVITKGIVPKGTKIPNFQAAMLIDELKAVDPSRVDIETGK